MPNNKWTKTATSASLAILGVTQLNNKADANIVQGGSNLTISGFGSHIWALDSVPRYGSVAQIEVYSKTRGTAGAGVFTISNQPARFFFAYSGSVIDGNGIFRDYVFLGNIDNAGPAQSGYFGFQDLKVSGAPIYGWAKWTTSATNTLTLNECITMIRSWHIDNGWG
jgi:hypothetical protein